MHIGHTLPVSLPRIPPILAGLPEMGATREVARMRHGWCGVRGKRSSVSLGEAGLVIASEGQVRLGSAAPAC